MMRQLRLYTRMGFAFRGFGRVERMGHIGLTLALAFGAPLSFSACDDENYKLPVGNFCAASSECETGLCLYGRCLDPLGDEDEDGLNNGIEAALGSNPFSADTDGDGILDKDEVGPNGEPIDTDGDGIPDILESAILDRDGDCLPDQYDPDDAKKATAEELQEWGAYLCSQDGVCKGQEASIIVSCNDEALVSCDYSAVPDYAEDELCDGLDNNCDGAVDEGHPDQDGDGVADCVDPDRDGDGVPNDEDNCPDVPNPQQEDANGNGLGDACDPPFVPVLTGFSKTSPGSGEVVTLFGTGEPHSRTLVFEDATCESEIGRGQVGEDGSWEAEVPLHEGENQFYLRAKNRFDLESSCVLGGLSFVRDESLPSDPSVGVVVAIDWDGDEETISSKARFRIEGELAGGGRALAYADPDCSEAIGEAEVPEGAFVIESEWVNSEQKTLYMAGETETGIKGQCIEIQSLFGELMVATGDSWGISIPGIPMQIHYPDGAPASPLVLSKSTGPIVFQGFLAGSTVTMLNDVPGERDGRATLLSFGPLEPDVAFSFPRFPGPGDSTEGISQDYIMEFFYPARPEGALYMSLFLPGGERVSAHQEAGTRGTYRIDEREFHGEVFDFVLVAFDRDDKPMAYMSQEGLTLPSVGETIEIDLSNENWQLDGWQESELVVHSDDVYSAQLNVELFSEHQDHLGYYPRPDGNLEEGNSNLSPGENRIVFKTPPLAGLRANLSVNVGGSLEPEVNARAWGSPAGGYLLPVHHGIDVVLDMLSPIESWTLGMAEKADGLKQIEAKFEHAGGFRDADVIGIFLGTQGSSEQWFYHMRGNELRDISFPRLSAGWGAYLSDFLTFPKTQWTGLFYVLEFNYNLPFEQMFGGRRFTGINDLPGDNWEIENALVYLKNFFKNFQDR